MYIDDYNDLSNEQIKALKKHLNDIEVYRSKYPKIEYDIEKLFKDIFCNEQFMVGNKVCLYLDDKNNLYSTFKNNDEYFECLIDFPITEYGVKGIGILGIDNFRFKRVYEYYVPEQLERYHKSVDTSIKYYLSLAIEEKILKKPKIKFD